MSSEIIDTNVLIMATAGSLGGKAPAAMAARGETVGCDDLSLQTRLWDWLKAFRHDPERKLVLDFPRLTIKQEYANKLGKDEFGMRVVLEKISRGEYERVDLTYSPNGSELVAELPDELQAVVHDLGDRKLVAAAMESGAAIHNATDTDWYDWQAPLEDVGVFVVHLIEDWSRPLWESKKAKRVSP